MRIKTGIAGFGLSGQVFHAPFIHANPGFELTAVVERRTPPTSIFVAAPSRQVNTAWSKNRS